MLNNLTPAPPNITLLLHEGMLSNVTTAPRTITMLQNESMLSNERPPLLNTSVSQNEATSQHHPSHQDAQINIANNLASWFSSASEKEIEARD